MTLTFSMMQQAFYQAWNPQRREITSVTIAERDYLAFFDSFYPAQEYQEFERWLLGQENINRFEDMRQQAFQRMTMILNQVNGKMIPFYRNPNQVQGTLVYTWKETPWTSLF